MQIKRRQITAKDIEKILRRDKKRLKTLSGVKAEALHKEIDRLRAQLADVRSGKVRIFQRIPQKIE